MVKFLNRFRYIVWITVFFSIIASIGAFLWGAIKSLKLMVSLVQAGGDFNAAAVSFLEVMDAFLIAAAVLIFCLGMYELFIGKLDLPDWLHVRNLHDLKAKIGGIAILVVVIAFIEQLMTWKNAQDMLYFALAIGIISAVLIAYSQFGGED
jgi:uncharacterized membrane protein YqhA